MEEKKNRPQDKWDAKAGMVSKSYKVKEETAKEFAAVCRKQGVSIGIKLTELMQAYIEENQ